MRYLRHLIIKKLHFYLLVLLLFIFYKETLSAGVLHGDYGGSISRKFYIGVYRSTAFQLVDSVEISPDGTLTVPLQNDWQGIIIVACGDYETSYEDAFKNTNQETSLQFVYEGQDIEYKTSWRHQSYPAYLKYGKGCEATIALNRLNMSFSRLQERMYHMENLMAKTPAGSRFYKELQREIIVSVKIFNNLCDSDIHIYSKNSFMTLYAKMYRQVFPPNNIALIDRSLWTAQHLFDYCDLQNPLTVNIPFFQDLIRRYLYLNMPVGVVSTDIIEKSQKDALMRLQERCNFKLPLPSFEDQQLRTEILTIVNMDDLYPSTGYHDTVNNWLGLYSPESGRYRGLFAEDMVAVLDKIRSKEVFTGFSKDLLVICTQFGWDNEKDLIVDYLSQNTVKLQNPPGIILRAIAVKNIKTGFPAPILAMSGNNKETEKLPRQGETTLLLFYESGCNHCDQIISDLIRDYEKYRSQNIRIITVSADTDKNVYKFHSKKYLWQDKYCDFMGYEGENFLNYGITGTPTIFVIDDFGNIKGQYATLSATGL